MAAKNLYVSKRGAKVWAEAAELAKGTSMSSVVEQALRLWIQQQRGKYTPREPDA